MEAIFTFTPQDHPSSSKMVEDLTLQKDFQDYVRMYPGVPLQVVLSAVTDHSEKERLYAFYHKAVLGVAIQVFTEDGWTGVDKIKADYLLKAECAKEPLYNEKTDEETIFLLDKASMNKDRLRKYVMDCVVFLEVEKGARVPDSSEYLIELQTGLSGFRKVGTKK